MDIRKEVQSILDEVFYPLGVYSYWQHKPDDNSNEQYFVYSVVTTPSVEYANDRILIRRYNVEILYYAKSDVFDYSLIERCQQAMFAHGYTLPVGEIDLGFLTDKDMRGIAMEFATERVVQNG